MSRLLVIALMLGSAALRRFMTCRRCVHWQRAGREGRCLRGVEGVAWCSMWEWKGLRP